MKNTDETKEYQKQWYNDNRENVIERQKNYNEANKEIRREYEKEWRKNNKEKVREGKRKYYLANKEKRKKYLKDNFERDKEKRSKYYQTAKLKKYGLNEEQYLERFNNQNGCCRICGTSQEKLKSSLHIDHNHKTGKVRGLLCVKCNNGIGQFNDSIELLEKTIEYLKNNS